MANKTAAQRKDAAEQAVETKAKEVDAKKAAEIQAKAAEAKAQTTPAKADAEAKDAQAQTDQVQPGADALSVFDQAVRFCLKGHQSGRTAPDATELWDALGCDQMPAKLAVAVFDCALDQGETIAERLLGKITVPVIGADDEIAEEAVDRVVTDFLAWRLRRYAFTGNAANKMLDWSRHILQLHAFILRDLQTG